MYKKLVSKYLLPVSTSLLTLLPVAGVLNASELVTRMAPEAVLTSLSDQNSLINIGEIEVFVRLTDESVVAWVNAQKAAGQPVPSAAEQQLYADNLGVMQESLSSQLKGMGAQELSRLRIGDNGIRVKIDASNIAAIRSLVGVAAVTKVIQYHTNLAKSVPWIGAEAVQSGGNDGAGVTIAIIDTGVDYLHANLGGAGSAADYANNDKNIVESGSFPTSKVIDGYDFAGAAYDGGGALPVPDADPLDGNGHGSHVAGIAAGIGVNGKIGAGVAPGASIMALKVFGDFGGSTSLVSDAIEYALDPNGDGDTSDHVDVINMSLGSDYGSPNDPSAVSAANAANLGIIVVASAGNSGDIPYITGSPAVAPNVVSVASSLAGGNTFGIDVNGNGYEAVEGTGVVRVADGVVNASLFQPSDPSNIFACDPIVDDLSGTIALISRGACSFDAKYINAQNAGALGIVVYNDGASLDRIAPFIMGGVGASGFPISISGVMISSFDGQSLSAAISGGVQVATLDAGILVPTNFADTLSSFTSRGPGNGGSQFKPDLTAPGQFITSTGAGTGDGTLTISGTSMASPHIAGVSALLVNAFPDLDPVAIKAMMQNTAVNAVPDGLVGQTPGLSRQGTGVVRADAAVALTSYATPGGISFGRINPKSQKEFEVEVELFNLSTEDRTYTVTHVPNQTFPGVDVSCPDSVSIDGSSIGKSKKSRKANKSSKSAEYSSKEFKIELEMDPTIGPFDDAAQSQTEVDGWCVLDDGTDQIRVGYMAVVDPASDMKVKFENGLLNIENKKGNLGWAEGFTLSSEDGLLLDKQYNAFRAIGFRSGSFAAFGDLIEFGITTERTWESFATAEIDIFIDVDGDGVDDATLVVADFFGDGLPVTAIFPQGAALFGANVDYNDGSTVLTFFSRIDAPLGFLGFLPAGDTDFDYTAVIFDVRSGEYDVQFGSVDLAAEIVPAASSFGLFPNTSANLPVSGSGDMLWLFQNNEAKKGKTDKQSQIVTVGVLAE